MSEILSGGKIDSGILVTFSDVSVDELTKESQKKNFSAVRKWTVDNLDNDPAVLLRRIYDALYSTLKNSWYSCLLCSLLLVISIRLPS